MINTETETMTTLKNQVSNIISKKRANYDHGTIKFDDLLKMVDCTKEELIVFINGCQDARIERAISY